MVARTNLIRFLKPSLLLSVCGRALLPHLELQSVPDTMYSQHPSNFTSTMFNPSPEVHHHSTTSTHQPTFPTGSIKPKPSLYHPAPWPPPHPLPIAIAIYISTPAPFPSPSPRPPTIPAPPSPFPNSISPFPPNPRPEARSALRPLLSAR